MLLSHWLAVSTLSTVTRSNITMMSGPNELSFMVVTLSEPSQKDAFSSHFCAHAAYHHLLFRKAAPAIVSYTNGLSTPPTPLPCQPVMMQFPLTLAWLISNQALCWFLQKPSGKFPDMDPFPSSPLTAPLRSCDPQLVLVSITPGQQHPFQVQAVAHERISREFHKMKSDPTTNNWVAALKERNFFSAV